MNEPTETTMEVDTSRPTLSIPTTPTADEMEDHQDTVSKMSSSAATLLELAGIGNNSTQSTITTKLQRQ